jgi:WD40 repeat protein
MKFKHPLRRGEKWLFVAPLLLFFFAFCLTSGKEWLRRQRGLPTRTIHFAGPDMLRLSSLSPGGEIVITQGESLVLKFYDVRDGAFLRELKLLPPQPGQNPWIEFPYRLDFTAGKDQLLVGFAGKPAELWDTRAEALKSPLPFKARRPTFSPNGRLVATDEGELWELGIKPRRILRSKRFADSPPAFSSDGALVAFRAPVVFKGVPRRDAPGMVTQLMGGGVDIFEEVRGTYKVRLSTSGVERSTNTFEILKGNKRLVCLEDIHVPDGFGIMGYNLRLLDIESRRELWKITDYKQPVKWHGIAVSSDGNWIAVSTWHDTVEIRDAQNGQLKTTLHANWRDVKENAMMDFHNLHFSRDGKFLVLRARRSICIWEMSEVRARLRH